MKNNSVTFKPSNVHQGYYVYINGKDTDIVINLFAYQTILEYKNKIDKKINGVIIEQSNAFHISKINNKLT